MSKKALSFLIFSLLSILSIVGNNIIIPNEPKEIRLLPESFKENYKSNKYNYEESVSLITRFKIWLIEKLKELLEIDNDSALETIVGLKYLLYFIVITLAVYVIIKMILGKEGRWIFKRNNPKDINPDLAIEEDIQSVNFEELIQKALGQNDYRLAIKYHYFSLLGKLDKTNVIKYDPQKTTYDYQLSLEGTKYNSIFSKAAYYYTYIWYGEFTIDLKEYQTISNIFIQLSKPINDE